jgi:3'-phosphoadenosine 5'-phosphosulfate sulfotransferase (PAPS reductase)/FAD synthetase
MVDYFKIDGPTCLSFSGGRSSAYMLHRVLQAHGGALPADTEVCFANTGLEDEATLQFVRDCGQYWNVPITWLEYRNDAAGFALVDFNTASRNGQPFAAIIAKRNYLPNPVTRFCTVELKIRAMHKYLKTLGWHEKFDGWEQMIGIRADEQRRVAKIRARGHSTESSHEEMRLPLADAGVTVGIVGKFWDEQSFTLDLPNRNGRTTAGNCVLCFLKPAAQVLSLIAEKPVRAVWWIGQEAQVQSTGLFTGDGARFRSDRPSYAQMAEYAAAQRDMVGYDEAIECFCGE